MEILALMFWGPLVGTLALTLLIGHLTKRRFRRLALLPLGLLLIPLVGGIHEWRAGGLFRELVPLLWGMIGGAIFLGWLAGWKFCRGKERVP